MRTKTALTELRKLVPSDYVLAAHVEQEMNGNTLRDAYCFISAKKPKGIIEERCFYGNCLEPCLQAASEWAIGRFGGSR